ncbi:MAG: tetratricopeptide repeat protein [Pirellulales bacterium]
MNRSHSLRRVLAATLGGLAVAAIVPAAWAQAPGGDTVVRTGDQRPIRGTVTQVARDAVTVRRGTTVEQVPANQIETIRYDDEPPKFNLARASERGGNLENAIQLYRETAEAAGTGRPQLLEDLQYYIARSTARLALADPARLDEAAGLLEAFVEQHPNSYHYYPLHEWLARVYMQTGNVAKARLALDTLRSAPWKEYQLRAIVAEGRLLQRQQQYEAAIAQFERVLAEQAATPDEKLQQQTAELAKAECLVALERFTDAEELLRGVIAAAPPERSDVHAAAHTALGDCLRAAGKAKEALLAYLYVDLLCADQKQEHAKALYYLAELWNEIGQPARAEDALARLQSDYPNSPWAKR